MTGLGLKRLVLNVVKTLGRQVAAGLLQLATVVVIARICGPEGNGVYNVALLLPTILAALLNLGIGPANVYYLGVGNHSLLTAWTATRRLWAVIALTGIILGAGVIHSFADDWFPGVSASLLWLALLSFPLLLLLNLMSSLFQGLQKFNEFNLVMVIQPLLTLVAILVLVLLGISDVGWFLSAYLLASLATLLVAIKILNALLPDQRKTESDGYGEMAIRYGYKAHLSNIFTFINYKADILLVNFFIGPAGAGVYVIAVQLAERLWMLSQSISTVILPRLSELSSDEKKRRQLTPMVSRWVLCLTLLFSVLLGFVARPLISLVFGEKFVDAIVPLWWLLPGIVLMAPARILANDIAARGRPDLNMYSSCAALFVNIVGNLMLIPDYGLAGAAIATSASYTLIFLLGLLMHQRFTGMPLWKSIILSTRDIEIAKKYILKRH